ncbi:hypothetical protein AURDEDRAFT_185937 [Auricularia subglabra TFB-10046 SS5]|nr:hypothetical protein AURDEDRAFT_185937 [Auricularia subglabra TFB-10046 SS5]
MSASKLSGLLSGTTLKVEAYQGVVFLPPPGRQSAERDAPVLYGDVILTLARPQHVGTIFVRHLTVYSIAIPGHKSENGTLQEDQTEVPVNAVLEKGEHRFPWCIHLPGTTLPYERNTYGRVEHRLLAHVPGISFLGHDLEASTVVKFVADLSQGGEDLRYEESMDGFVEDLGPYSVGLKSPFMTVGGLLYFSLHLPCVPTEVRLHAVAMHIRQKFELSSPADPSITAHAPFQTFSLLKLDHDTPRAHPSERPVVEPDVLVTTNARPHPAQYDQRLLAVVPQGEPAQMAYLVRLPRDDALRPTTGATALARPIRASHEAHVEIRYWTPGSKERVARMSKAVSFASCCCLVESMNLPDYNVSSTSATPKDAQALKSMIQKCACEISTADILALHRKDIIAARRPPSSTAKARDSSPAPKRRPRPPDAPVLSAHDIDVLAREGGLVLSPPYVSAYLKRKRSVQSLAAVMPAVEDLLAHGFQANPFILGVLLGRDTWRPGVVRELAAMLRVVPNRVNWSQAMNNALRLRGHLSALEVFEAASEDGGRPQASAVNNVVHALINRTSFYRPDAHALRRAFQLTKGQLEAWVEGDDSRIEPLNLIAALSGTHAVPTKREDIAYLLDAMKHHGHRLHPSSHLAFAMEKIYRADSFEAAVTAVWKVQRIQTASYSEHLGLLGRVVRLRFQERSSLPFDHLARYLDNITKGGDDVQPDAFMVALTAYAEAGVQLKIEEEVAALGGPQAAAAHAALVRADISALESHVRATQDADLADVRTRCALLQAHSSAGDFERALALWDTYPHPSAQLLTAALTSCRVHKDLRAARAVWAAALERGAPADGRAFAAWAECLADNGAWGEAVATLEHMFAADPDTTRSAVRILRWVSPSAPLRRRVLDAMPETWADPAIMEDYDVSSAQRRMRAVRKLLQNVPHLAAV